MTPGQRSAVHAGAASKLLLANRPEAEIDAWLARPLIGFTAKTITDPSRLRTELSRIRRLGWAQDKGESAPAIQAFASPVLDSNGKVIAAISVPFLAGTEPARMEEIRLAVIEAAKDFTRAVPRRRATRRARGLAVRGRSTHFGPIGGGPPAAGRNFSPT